ncbi:MAG: DUF4405 domain-containing protein [Rhizomicrobium sp.]
MSHFLRTYATPLSLACFGAIGVSGVMMFIGLRNHQLGELHEWLGIIFLIAAALHICRNWRALLAMLAKTQSKIIVGVLGTIAILLIGSTFFGGGEGGGPDHGPGGMQAVEMRLSYTPLAQLAPAFGLSSSQVVARLRKGGIIVNGPGQNLTEISQKQNVPVPRLLNMIAAEPGAMPDPD